MAHPLDDEPPSWFKPVLDELHDRELQMRDQRVHHQDQQSSQFPIRNFLNRAVAIAAVVTCIVLCVGSFCAAIFNYSRLHSDTEANKQALIDQKNVEKADVQSLWDDRKELDDRIRYLERGGNQGR